MVKIRRNYSHEIVICIETSVKYRYIEGLQPDQVETPVLVHSSKLSNIEFGQYLDG